MKGLQSLAVQSCTPPSTNDAGGAKFNKNCTCSSEASEVSVVQIHHINEPGSSQSDNRRSERQEGWMPNLRLKEVTFPGCVYCRVAAHEFLARYGVVGSGCERSAADFW